MAQFSRLLRMAVARFRSAVGAIDLASIMIGVLVMGILGSIIAAAVFAVIPWSQDAAAKASLDTVKVAESVHFAQKTKYGDAATLAAAKFLPTSANVVAGTNVAADCYVGVSRSATGIIYYRSDADTAPKVYGSGSTSSCTDLPTLINPLLLAGGPGGATPIVNLATNPSFETAGPAVTVRTNLIANPSAETDLVGWENRWFGSGGTGTYSRPAGGGVSGGFSYRSTWTAAGNGADAGSGGNFTAAAGATYTVSGSVRSSFATTAQAYVFWKDASNAIIGNTVVFDQIAAPANTWVRPTQTVTAPANAVTGLFLTGPYYYATVMPVGATLDIDQLLVEQTSTVGPYFDGATAAATDFTYAWSGPANASLSVQRAPGLPAEAGAPRSVIHRSSEWKSSGSRSMKVFPDQAGTYNGIVLYVPIVVGRTYTFTATVRTTTSTRINFAPDGIGVNTSPTMAAGETRTFTLTGVANRSTLDGYIRAIDPGSAPFFVDDVTVVEGAYSGPFFDGGSTGAYWLGAPNASQSLRN